MYGSIRVPLGRGFYSPDEWKHAQHVSTLHRDIQPNGISDFVKYVARIHGIRDDEIEFICRFGRKRTWAEWANISLDDLHFFEASKPFLDPTKEDVFTVTEWIASFDRRLGYSPRDQYSFGNHSNGGGMNSAMDDEGIEFDLRIKRMLLRYFHEESDLLKDYRIRHAPPGDTARGVNVQWSLPPSMPLMLSRESPLPSHPVHYTGPPVPMQLVYSAPVYSSIPISSPHVPAFTSMSNVQPPVVFTQKPTVAPVAQSTVPSAIPSTVSQSLPTVPFIQMAQANIQGQHGESNLATLTALVETKAQHIQRLRRIAADAHEQDVQGQAEQEENIGQGQPDTVPSRPSFTRTLQRGRPILPEVNHQVPVRRSQKILRPRYTSGRIPRVKITARKSLSERMAERAGAPIVTLPPEFSPSSIGGALIATRNVQRARQGFQLALPSIAEESDVMEVEGYDTDDARTSQTSMHTALDYIDSNSVISSETNGQYGYALEEEDEDEEDEGNSSIYDSALDTYYESTDEYFSVENEDASTVSSYIDILDRWFAYSSVADGEDGLDSDQLAMVVRPRLPMPTNRLALEDGQRALEYGQAMNAIEDGTDDDAQSMPSLEDVEEVNRQELMDIPESSDEMIVESNGEETNLNGTLVVNPIPPGPLNSSMSEQETDRARKTVQRIMDAQHPPRPIHPSSGIPGQVPKSALRKQRVQARAPVKKSKAQKEEESNEPLLATYPTIKDAPLETQPAVQQSRATNNGTKRERQPRPSPIPVFIEEKLVGATLRFKKQLSPATLKAIPGIQFMKADAKLSLHPALKIRDDRPTKQANPAPPNVQSFANDIFNGLSGVFGRSAQGASVPPTPVPAPSIQPPTPVSAPPSAPAPSVKPPTPVSAPPSAPSIQPPTQVPTPSVAPMAIPVVSPSVQHPTPPAPPVVPPVPVEPAAPVPQAFAKQEEKPKNELSTKDALVSNMKALFSAEYSEINHIRTFTYIMVRQYTQLGFDPSKYFTAGEYVAELDWTISKLNLKIDTFDPIVVVRRALASLVKSKVMANISQEEFADVFIGFSTANINSKSYFNALKHVLRTNDDIIARDAIVALIERKDTKEKILEETLVKLRKAAVASIPDESDRGYYESYLRLHDELGFVCPVKDMKGFQSGIRSARAKSILETMYVQDLFYTQVSTYVMALQERDPYAHEATIEGFVNAHVFRENARSVSLKMNTYEIFQNLDREGAHKCMLELVKGANNNIEVVKEMANRERVGRIIPAKISRVLTKGKYARMVFTDGNSSNQLVAYGSNWNTKVTAEAAAIKEYNDRVNEFNRATVWYDILAKRNPDLRKDPNLGGAPRNLNNDEMAVVSALKFGIPGLDTLQEEQFKERLMRIGRMFPEFDFNQRVQKLLATELSIALDMEWVPTHGIRLVMTEEGKDVTGETIPGKKKRSRKFTVGEKQEKTVSVGAASVYEYVSIAAHPAYVKEAVAILLNRFGSRIPSPIRTRIGKFSDGFENSVGLLLAYISGDPNEISRFSKLCNINVAMPSPAVDTQWGSVPANSASTNRSTPSSSRTKPSPSRPSNANRTQGTSSSTNVPPNQPTQDEDEEEDANVDNSLEARKLRIRNARDKIRQKLVKQAPQMEEVIREYLAINMEIGKVDIGLFFQYFDASFCPLTGLDAYAEDSPELKNLERMFGKYNLKSTTLDASLEMEIYMMKHYEYMIFLLSQSPDRADHVNLEFILEGFYRQVVSRAPIQTGSPLLKQQADDLLRSADMIARLNVYRMVMWHGREPALVREMATMWLTMPLEMPVYREYKAVFDGMKLQRFGVPKLGFLEFKQILNQLRADRHLLSDTYNARIWIREVIIVQVTRYYNERMQTDEKKEMLEYAMSVSTVLVDLYQFSRGLLRSYTSEFYVRLMCMVLLRDSNEAIRKYLDEVAHVMSSRVLRHWPNVDGAHPIDPATNEHVRKEFAYCVYADRLNPVPDDNTRFEPLAIFCERMLHLHLPATVQQLSEEDRSTQIGLAAIEYIKTIWARLASGVPHGWSKIQMYCLFKLTGACKEEGINLPEAYDKAYIRLWSRFITMNTAENEIADMFNSLLRLLKPADKYLQRYDPEVFYFLERGNSDTNRPFGHFISQIRRTMGIGGYAQCKYFIRKIRELTGKQNIEDAIGAVRIQQKHDLSTAWQADMDKITNAVAGMNDRDRKEYINKYYEDKMRHLFGEDWALRGNTVLPPGVTPEDYDAL